MRSNAPSPPCPSTSLGADGLRARPDLATGVRRRLLGSGLGLAAMALPFALGGCAGLPPADMIPPRVSVADVSVDQLGLTDIALTVTLDIENPNVYELPLADLRAELELIGRPFGSGWARETTSIVPAKARRSVPVAFSVPTTRLLALMRAFRLGDAQRIGYRLSGSARWGERGLRVPFERSGDLQAWTRALDDLGPLLR